jgi:hypothetical protein
MKRIAESPPRYNDRIVGAYYLLTMLAGVLVIFFHGRLVFAADLIATVVYIGITKLFYTLSKKRLARDDRNLSRSVIEPVRTITFWRLGRPHFSRARALDKSAMRHGNIRVTKNYGDAVGEGLQEPHDACSLRQGRHNFRVMTALR